MHGYVLVGPTASGKTAVAHRLAERLGLRLLSADAMLVYRGMDVGTAKPSPDEQRRFGYAGVDLVDPDRTFSVGDYLRAVTAQTAPAGEETRIVAGGTGLYVKCLTQGLDREAVPPPAVRRRVEAIFHSAGVAGLRAELGDRDPHALAALADPDNPRRLMRALERVLAGAERGDQGGWERREPPVVVGLLPERAWHAARIAERVQAMYDGGLESEAEGLRARFGALSRTAAQAIAYREAFERLAGKCSAAEAIERTIVRTRQYAKRQMTWFRHQARVEWIDVDGHADPGRVATAVEARWHEHGSVPLELG